MASENLPGEDRAYQIQVPCVVFFVATTFVVTVRLWARIKLRSWSGIGWDDGTIVASWIFATTVSALMMASCSYGFGQHVTELTTYNKLMTLKLFYVAQAFYKLTINLTKASIILLYLRIFVKRWFRLTCYALLAVILSYMVATFSASVWQCTPVARAWDKSTPGTCIDIASNWKANSGFSIATDFIILALPMYPIYTSMLPWGQKVALIVVFALGVFTTITSILRLQALDFSIKSPDVTYDIDSSIWTMIEENLAILCACLPTCRLPLAYAFPAYFSSTDSAKGLATSSSNKDPQSYASIFPANLHSSPIYNQEGPDLKEKPIIDNSPPTRPSTTSPATVGWEADPESGRSNMLSHVCTCGTSAVDNHGDSCGSSRHEVELDSRVIRMITHYSITYDDNKPPESGS